MTLLLALGALDTHLKQAHGSLLHVGVEGLDAAEDVVVEDLENQCDDNTEDGGDKGDLHTSGNDGRADITCALDVIEGLHHTYHSAKEAE